MAIHFKTCDFFDQPRDFCITGNLKNKQKKPNKRNLSFERSKNPSSFPFDLKGFVQTCPDSSSFIKWTETFLKLVTACFL